MTRVFADDMSRGVVGLVAEIRDVLLERSTVVLIAEGKETEPAEVLHLADTMDLAEIVEALVEVAEKYGARA